MNIDKIKTEIKAAVAAILGKQFSSQRMKEIYLSVDLALSDADEDDLEGWLSYIRDDDAIIHSIDEELTKDERSKIGDKVHLKLMESINDVLSRYCDEE